MVIVSVGLATPREVICIKLVTPPKPLFYTTCSSLTHLGSMRPDGRFVETDELRRVGLAEVGLVYSGLAREASQGLCKIIKYCSTHIEAGEHVSI